jgi:hypothetical protein
VNHQSGVSSLAEQHDGPLCFDKRLCILHVEVEGDYLPTQRIDLPQGKLDLLILRTLGLGPQHGWGISERVQQMSSDVLRIQQGSLYPALHRLERRGWIKPAGGLPTTTAAPSFTS